MTAAQLRADLQRRMNMTTRVDTLVEVLDSIRLITRDSILAYSSQRFVRLIRLDNGSERQRISTITHERPVIRSRGQWKLVGAVREIAPRAWWADEAPPAPAGLTGGTRNSAAVDTARALDSAWARSYATHDTVLAATLFSDRLMVTSADGRMKDKAAELADIRPAAGLHMHHFPTSDVRTEPFPGTAVVTGVADWAFRYNGQENALRRRYTAVYVRGGVLGWQLVALHLGRAP
jgi:ketosteroid isomerase-like protein